MKKIKKIKSVVLTEVVFGMKKVLDNNMYEFGDFKNGDSVVEVYEKSCGKTTLIPLERIKFIELVVITEDSNG